jgi:hypothetical protein
MTYQTAGIFPVRLAHDLARLAVVEDELSVTCARGKQISVRRESDISDESVVSRNHFVVLERYSGVEDERVVVGSGHGPEWTLMSH